MKISRILSASAVALFAGVFANAAHASVVAWTMTGTISYAESLHRSDYVPNTCGPGCGSYTTTTASDGSAVGLNVQVGDHFTATYTFDSSALPTVYSFSNGYYTDYREEWLNFQHSGVLTSTINGQTWSGSENYSQSYSIRTDDGINATSNERVVAQQYQGAYFYQQTYVDPSGVVYNNNSHEWAGIGFTEPSGITDFSSSVFYEAFSYFQFHNYLSGPSNSVPNSPVAGGFPNAIDIGDWMSRQFVWYANGARDLNCGIATGNGQESTCAWSELNRYYFGGTIDSIVSDTANVLPAPGALALLGFGLIGLGATRRRKA